MQEVVRLVSTLGLSKEGTPADGGESGCAGPRGVEKGGRWSLAGGGAKARGIGPCGFSQSEGGGRGEAALLS